jgi:hypothetical protein
MGNIRRIGLLVVLDDCSDQELFDGILRTSAKIVETGNTLVGMDEPTIYDYYHEIGTRLRKNQDCPTLTLLKPHLLPSSSPGFDDTMKVAALLYPFHLQQERAKLRVMDHALAKKEEAATIIAQNIREEAAVAQNQIPSTVEKNTSTEEQLQQIQIIDAITQNKRD